MFNYSIYLSWRIQEFATVVLFDSGSRFLRTGLNNSDTENRYKNYAFSWQMCVRTLRTAYVYDDACCALKWPLNTTVLLCFCLIWRWTCNSSVQRQPQTSWYHQLVAHQLLECSPWQVHECGTVYRQPSAEIVLKIVLFLQKRT